MTAVGQSALENVVIEVFRDLLADRNAAQLNISAGNALCEAYEIGLYAEVLECEHLTGASESCHDLVADHHDTVVVADLAYSFKVALRRNNNAVGAR